MQNVFQIKRSLISRRCDWITLTISETGPFMLHDMSIHHQLYREHVIDDK